MDPYLNETNDSNVNITPPSLQSEEPQDMIEVTSYESEVLTPIQETKQPEPPDPINHNQPSHKGKKWYFKLALYIVILTFVSGTTFGAGYLTALVYGDQFALNSSNSKNGSQVNDPGISVTQVQPVVSSTNSGSDIATIAAEVSPAIVTISSIIEASSNSFFGGSSGGTGSGIAFRVEENDLLIATNYHVIEGATSLEVTFSDGTVAPAKSLGYDSNIDVAVLSVDLSSLKEMTNNIVVATFGDSDKIQIGELAVAIGNPLGAKYASTVTSGIISALNREIYIDQNTTQVNLIQTDAAINPGNSGGALLNGRGEVIGINSAKYVDTSVEGIGFAIPINQAEETINSILENRDGADIAYALSDDRAFLGVQIADITADIYNETGMRFGVYITGVFPYSGADEAGIIAGDIIYSINGKKIANVQGLFNVLETAKVGDSIEIGVIRNDEIMTVDAPLYSYKDVMAQQKE